MSVLVNHRCAACGAAMEVKTNRQNGQQFLGCTQWPQCGHTEKVPEYVRLKQQGWPELPGLGV